MVESYLDFDFPPELCHKAQSLVAFIGLDIQNNNVHKNVWEMFSSNRHTDRVPIEFTLFSSDFTLPTQKPKRASYEWYVPKGILKTNWISKHLRLIPSVIVLFYELDWDDPHWSEKKLDCASQIHSIKSAVEGRNIKIALILIQKSSVLLSSGPEGKMSTERASELCTTCDLYPELLLLLHHNEHLQGYIVRLENVFHELAQNYYTQEIRKIKLHKEHLNKTSHQYLYVRHQFKIAFFNEMKHDLNAAHKHYMLANSSLLELRVNDTNINEMKVVGSFITYKLCKIYFAQNQPRDAISQFNTHIERSRLKTGIPELIFEHYAWLSRQFVTFGDLFEDAARQGLPAAQARHPGFYYEQAAQYAVQRKKLVTDEPIQYPENDPLNNWDKVEFYGQRPWRLGNRTEPFDVVREQLAIVALQYREKYVINHSAIIISYLGNAIGQFKLYRSPRKRRFLAVQMADEYYQSKDYGKALTLFTHMLWEYRNDKWWELTCDLLKKALNCAYLTASFQEYVDLCVEALFLFPDLEKKRILSNLKAIIQSTYPDMEPSLPETDTSKAKELWMAQVHPSSARFVNVDMHSSTSFMQCKATFLDADSNSVSTEIWLRNEFPEEIQFSQLIIGVASPSRNTEYCIIKETDPTSDKLRFKSGEIKCIPYNFVPLAVDINSEIQLSYVVLTMGFEDSPDNRMINLRFSGIWNESDIIRKSGSEELKLYSKQKDNFCKVESVLRIQIRSKISQMKIVVSHKPPSLTSEWYPISISIKNEEAAICRNCILSVTMSVLPSVPVTPSVDNVIFKHSSEIFEDINSNPCQLPLSLSIGDINVDETVEKILYFKTRAVESKNVSFRVGYNIVNVGGEEISITTEETIQLDCVNVYEVTASFLSVKCEHISKIYADEPLLMRTQVDCVSPWPVFVEGTKFTLHKEQVSWKEDLYPSYLKHCTLKTKEEYFQYIGEGMASISRQLRTRECTLEHNDVSEMQQVLVSHVVGAPRKDDDERLTVHTEVQLPQVKVEKLPLYIDINISSPGWVRTPLSLKLMVQNNSDELMSFDISVEHNETDAFMFSGSKQMSFSVIPGESYPIYYNLFPLQAGNIPLPYIKLTVHSDLITQTDLTDLLKRTLPSTLFVMPQRKGNETNVNDLLKEV